MTFPDRPSGAAELSESNYECWAREQLVRLQLLKDKIIGNGQPIKPGFIRQKESLLFGDGTTLYSILFVNQDSQPAALIYISSKPSDSKKYCAQFSIVIFVDPNFRHQGISNLSLSYCHETIQSIISEQNESKPAIICQQIGIPNTDKYRDLRSRIIKQHLSQGYKLINFEKGQLTKEIYPNSK